VGTISSIEGEAPKDGIVIIAFDSAQKAREWYDSPAYDSDQADPAKISQEPHIDRRRTRSQVTDGSRSLEMIS
jgi:uncharacterized protein (DUF1330 family)